MRIHENEDSLSQVEVYVAEMLTLPMATDPTADLDIADTVEKPDSEVVKTHNKPL